ncbi:hypothetical protein CRG98_023957 [Punica granatum]|uniref:Uncharacterized protein n=1 Tax=Punica granatum TaxID=22663 RepID=A0A2I0JJ85_PUNGR|nr:hypothetical protein CRG98_023957 [Punica granatum]
MSQRLESLAEKASFSTLESLARVDDFQRATEWAPHWLGHFGSCYSPTLATFWKSVNSVDLIVNSTSRLARTFSDKAVGDPRDLLESSRVTMDQNKMLTQESTDAVSTDAMSTGSGHPQEVLLSIV